MMEQTERKKHWEKIYQTRQLHDVSWYEPVPHTSLAFLKELNVPKSARIIDIGGGDSLLVDHLLDKGYTDITVLDISEAALERAKNRLGEKANHVKWIVADAAHFRPVEKYDFWHDRAAFHFLTNDHEVKTYLDTVQENLNPGGILIIGTFSEEGPKKCSGLEIRQYSEEKMTALLSSYFEKIKCIKVDHPTPSGMIQNFVFCSFRKASTDVIVEA
jgi:ubiquinone/menaquinone biosynthesis C-methylase UbiE